MTASRKLLLSATAKAHQDDDNSVFDHELAKDMAALAIADNRTKFLGGDAEVERLALLHNLGREGIAITKIDSFGKVVTLICVPADKWSGQIRCRLRALKTEAANIGHRCVLVPANFVRRQPRLENSQAIMRNRGVHVSATARLRIVGLLIDQGWSTIMDCCSVLDHQDAVGALFHLIAIGTIKIDLNQPITPFSLVELTSAAH